MTAANQKERCRTVTDNAEQRAVTRQALTATTFVEIVDTLVDNFDVIDVLTVLTSRCVELLEAAAAGILLADETRHLRVIGASTEQVELQTLHRIRDRVVVCRTQLVNQMRAFCLEFGIGMRNGVGMFKAEFPKVLGDEFNDLTPRMRSTLSELWNEFKASEVRMDELTREIEGIAKQSELAMRLTSVPGIGYLGATAILAAVGDRRQFKKARDLAAWIGLVPAQHSTGGKPTLLGVSKRGNSYIRRLLIHGARSCLMNLDRTRDRLGSWLDALQARMHVNKVVVALANKLARIAWIVLNKPNAVYVRTGNARI